ncbi:MAG: carboxy-S-adenosyl-L-methionine synthase CmoA [Victivallales bacterium]|nr:carboxy-S-adenosyl-L-methionine synthase CmoA [Victivallales bacterium]
MKNRKFDDIYAENVPETSNFEFNEAVAEVFPDMISRSVPGYLQTLDIVEVAAAKFAVTDTVCYDLGCSLGGASFRIASAVGASGCEIIAVDNSPAMIERLEKRLKEFLRSGRIRPVLADIADINFNTTSFAVMAYTLQFVPLERRSGLLARLRRAMLPGSALVLSEKIAFDSESESRLMNALHLEFKRRNGYSDMEIARKRSALENVLVPETLEKHFERLRSAGFGEVFTVSRHMNFATLIALT